MTRYIFLLIAVLAVGGSAKKLYEYEDDLVRQLFSNYLRETIPQVKSGEPVKVQVGAALINIEDVNVRKGEIVLNAWLQLGWKDSRLTWDPSQFGGIKSIRVSPSAVWIPDISFYDTIIESAKVVVTGSEVNVVVNSDGSILYVPPIRAQTKVSMEGTPEHFSFTMKAGSWTYDGYKLDVELWKGREEMDTSYLTENNTWNVVKTHLKREVKHYDCCPEPYPNIAFKITLRKRN